MEAEKKQAVAAAASVGRKDGNWATKMTAVIPKKRRQKKPDESANNVAQVAPVDSSDSSQDSTIYSKLSSQPRSKPTHSVAKDASSGNVPAAAEDAPRRSTNTVDSDELELYRVMYAVTNVPPTEFSCKEIPHLIDLTYGDFVESSSNPSSVLCKEVPASVVDYPKMKPLAKILAELTRKGDALARANPSLIAKSTSPNANNGNGSAAVSNNTSSVPVIPIVSPSSDSDSKKNASCLPKSSPTSSTSGCQTEESVLTSGNSSVMSGKESAIQVETVNPEPEERSAHLDEKNMLSSQLPAFSSRESFQETKSVEKRNLLQRRNANAKKGAPVIAVAMPKRKRTRDDQPEESSSTSAAVQLTPENAVSPRTKKARTGRMTRSKQCLFETGSRLSKPSSESRSKSSRSLSKASSPKKRAAKLIANAAKSLTTPRKLRKSLRSQEGQSSINPIPEPYVVESSPVGGATAEVGPTTQKTVQSIAVNEDIGESCGQSRISTSPQSKSASSSGTSPSPAMSTPSVASSDTIDPPCTQSEHATDSSECNDKRSETGSGASEHSTGSSEISAALRTTRSAIHKPLAHRSVELLFSFNELRSASSSASNSSRESPAKVTHPKPGVVKVAENDWSITRIEKSVSSRQESPLMNGSSRDELTTLAELHTSANPVKLSLEINELQIGKQNGERSPSKKRALVNSPRRKSKRTSKRSSAPGEKGKLQAVAQNGEISAEAAKVDREAPSEMTLQETSEKETATTSPRVTRSAASRHAKRPQRTSKSKEVSAAKPCHSHSSPSKLRNASIPRRKRRVRASRTPEPLLSVEESPQHHIASEESLTVTGQVEAHSAVQYAAGSEQVDRRDVAGNVAGSSVGADNEGEPTSRESSRNTSEARPTSRKTRTFTRVENSTENPRKRSLSPAENESEPGVTEEPPSKATKPNREDVSLIAERRQTRSRAAKRQTAQCPEIVAPASGISRNGSSVEKRAVTPENNPQKVVSVSGESSAGVSKPNESEPSEQEDVSPISMRRQTRSRTAKRQTAKCPETAALSSEKLSLSKGSHAERPPVSLDDKHQKASASSESSSGPSKPDELVPSGSLTDNEKPSASLYGTEDDVSRLQTPPAPADLADLGGSHPAVEAAPEEDRHPEKRSSSPAFSEEIPVPKIMRAMTVQKSCSSRTLAPRELRSRSQSKTNQANRKKHQLTNGTRNSRHAVPGTTRKRRRKPDMTEFYIEELKEAQEGNRLLKQTYDKVSESLAQVTSELKETQRELQQRKLGQERLLAKMNMLPMVFRELFVAALCPASSSRVYSTDFVDFVRKTRQFGPDLQPVLASVGIIIPNYNVPLKSLPVSDSDDESIDIIQLLADTNEQQELPNEQPQSSADNTGDVEADSQNPSSSAAPEQPVRKFISVNPKAPYVPIAQVVQHKAPLLGQDLSKFGVPRPRRPESPEV